MSQPDPTVRVTTGPSVAHPMPHDNPSPNVPPPSTSRIPPCWYGHDRGDVCPHCVDWWMARSVADPRAARPCGDQHAHQGPHPWWGATPTPLPFTTWVCPGLARCAPEVAEIVLDPTPEQIREAPCTVCGGDTCDMFFCYWDQL